MAAMSLTTLFQDHIAERRARLEDALSAAKLDALVISSGEPHVYFSDDEEANFRSVDHFSHWCPLQGPHHALVLRAGEKPRLIRYAPEDYWYEAVPLGDPFWLAEFDVLEVATVEAVWESVGRLTNAAYLGNEAARAADNGIEPAAAGLVSRLDWDRAYKTDYELHCLDEASALAAKGHRAAEEAFHRGASELEMHWAFVGAMEVTDHELPYQTIIALDEKAAVLHYHAKRAVRDGRVLLIDAGGASRGYASDITRTHVRESADARFVALRDGMNALQKELCEGVRPGLAYGALHHDAHLKIAALLQRAELVDADPEESVAQGLSQPFFPHGLGHHLGLQVHDVGGHLADPDGTPAPPPSAHPFLRNTRTIEERHVFTIEPGLYFIAMLLRPLREGKHAARFNWALIDELSPLGGIRIEDNVVVTTDGHRNLTRPHLP